MLALLFGYLLGSVPFGLLLTRAMGLGDIRSIGSGNIGATNVLRTGNKPLAAATLLADVLKGLAPVFLAAPYGREAAMLAGAGAFLGHLYPVWLGFRGGKGVATFIGVLLGLSWQLAVLFCFIWLLTAVLFRISSLAALVAAAAMPLAVATTGDQLLVITVMAMTILVFVKHRENIKRLMQGEESKIGKK